MSVNEALADILAIDRYAINTDELNETKFKPINRQTVTYIVAVVLINERNEVCLIQEAKASCRGQWYFPAGRVENNENLMMAAKRECLEETGYEVEPVNLCLVEIGYLALWYRFTFTAVIVGGSLKSTEKADEESLQAKWFNIGLLKDKKFLQELRSFDFIKSVEIAHKFYHNINFNSNSDRQLNKNLIISENIPCENITFSFLILDSNANSYLIYNKNGSDYLPLIVNCPLRHSNRYSANFFGDIIQKSLFTKCFNNSSKINIEVKGILSVKYDATTTRSDCLKDGIEITFLAVVNTTSLPKTEEAFLWRSFNENKWENIKSYIESSSNYTQLDLC